MGVVGVLWPLTDAGIAQSGVVNTSASVPITVTASGTTTAKGPWTELVDVVACDTATVVVMSRETIATNGSDTSLLLDLGIGGPGVETPIVSNLMWGHHLGERVLPIPIRVPAGARLCARIQSATSSKTMEVSCVLLGGGYATDAGSRATTYGINTTTVTGVALSTPGGANTKGAWTEISSGTAAPLRWMIPMAAPPAGITALSNCDGLIDFGYGASGHEQVLVANLPYRHTSGEACRFPPITLPCNLPAGTRLVARHQATVTTHVPAVAVIGVD